MSHYKIHHLLLLLLSHCTLMQCAHSLSMNSNNSSSNSNKRNLTAAQQARKAEDQRRKARQHEVVPGRTSAIPGAHNYELNIPQTQYLLDQSSTAHERQIRQWITQGMDSLKLLQVENANEAFEKVGESKEDAYVWQAGLAKFYMDDFGEAAERFVHHGTLYERKFRQPASEERIWRDACELNLLTKSTKKERKAMKPIIQMMEPSDQGEDGMEDMRETRKVIRMARELFAASIEKDLSTIALARAKLRSVCGEYDAATERRTTTDKKMWRLTAWFYLGLHYDVTGNYEESKHCMKMALRQCGSNNSDDIIQTLPMLHMTRRDWFDDDLFEEDTGSSESVGTIPVKGTLEDKQVKDTATNMDLRSISMQSIEESVNKMRVVDLRQALKERGIKTTGSKSVLKDRLLQALQENVDFQ